MNFNEELKAKAVEAEKIIEAYLPKAEGPQKTVIEAMNYSVRLGGKRLRPVIMREFYTMYGGRGKIVEPFMAALEMIHTYSLVHDDLPVMDNDLLRRGKPSTHAVYGAGMATLAGDGLLNLAFETAFLAFDFKEDTGAVPAALKILAEKAGFKGMLGGQVVDVESEGKSVSEETLNFIHEKKTACMLESAAMTGAVLAGAGEEELKKIENLMSLLGVAFQVRDDILDVTGDEALLGKPVGSDEKNNKTTFVTLYGLSGAEKEAERLAAEALSAAGGLSAESEFFNALIRYLVERDF
ncbi:MAG: polyprenyl synthetase family protein [Lachnospiraceae bacterium]|nr:polyprenyl synthetase family protein [Lachnospiraceae bacterium]